jgi:uncharacterized protein YraI
MNKTASICFGLVAGASLLAPAVAEAAPARVQAPTNLRQGPGLEYGIVAALPVNAPVEVTGCTGQWCSVQWGPHTGYVVAKNLDRKGLVPMGMGPAAVTPVAPPPVVAEPGPVVGPPAVVAGPPAVYIGPGYYYGPRWGWYRW